ncbi:hypothetical protein F5887DRAFT_926302 [Amanita rubescens]|nr:hypothetical protein F5887DRAFT_926302 [Amanita rubescens]
MTAIKSRRLPQLGDIVAGDQTKRGLKVPYYSVDGRMRKLLPPPCAACATLNAMGKRKRKEKEKKEKKEKEKKEKEKEKKEKEKEKKEKEKKEKEEKEKTKTRRRKEEGIEKHEVMGLLSHRAKEIAKESPKRFPKRAQRDRQREPKEIVNGSRSDGMEHYSYARPQQLSGPAGRTERPQLLHAVHNSRDVQDEHSSLKESLCESRPT